MSRLNRPDTSEAAPSDEPRSHESDLRYWALLGGPIGRALSDIAEADLTIEDEALAAKVLLHLTNNEDDAPHQWFATSLRVFIEQLEDE